MEYAIIKNQYSGFLISEVNDSMKAGWKPLGGIAVSESPSGMIYIQALTKE